MRASFLCGLGCISVFLLGCANTSSKTPVTVSIAPTVVSAVVGMTQQFTATVTSTSNTTGTWSVAGGAPNGTITSTGVYTAPVAVPNPPQLPGSATSQARMTESAVALITVVSSTSASFS